MVKESRETGRISALGPAVLLRVDLALLLAHCSRRPDGVDMHIIRSHADQVGGSDAAHLSVVGKGEPLIRVSLPLEDESNTSTPWCVCT